MQDDLVARTLKIERTGEPKSLIIQVGKLVLRVEENNIKELQYYDKVQQAANEYGRRIIEVLAKPPVSDTITKIECEVSYIQHNKDLTFLRN